MRRKKEKKNVRVWWWARISQMRKCLHACLRKCTREKEREREREGESEILTTTKSELRSQFDAVVVVAVPNATTTTRTTTTTTTTPTRKERKEKRRRNWVLLACLLDWLCWNWIGFGWVGLVWFGLAGLFVSYWLCNKYMLTDDASKQQAAS